MSSTLAVTDATFDAEVLQSAKPVLVDFWAPWCGPCRTVGPILDALAAEKAGITVAKINVDENPHVAAKLGVRSIPTLFLFRDGKQLSTKVGALSRSALDSWLAENGI